MFVEFMKIMETLNYPPIFLILPEQFAMLDGEENREKNMVSDEIAGIAAVRYPVITIHPWLEGKMLTNTLWHEVGHHLWPWRQHWWIEMFAEKMANGGGRGYYSHKYKKKRTDLPPKAELLVLARRQAEKLKWRYRI